MRSSPPLSSSPPARPQPARRGRSPSLPGLGRPSMWLSYVLIGAVRALLGATPRWIGSSPEDRQRVYFANHTSHIDTVALWSALPPDLRAKTRTAAAADYWGTSALKRTIALKALNAVLIDRKRSDPQADPLRPLYEVLEAGQSVIIFPEGT